MKPPAMVTWGAGAGKQQEVARLQEEIEVCSVIFTVAQHVSRFSGTRGEKTTAPGEDYNSSREERGRTWPALKPLGPGRSFVAIGVPCQRLCSGRVAHLLAPV
jgi:hypothetical protein